ncbi:glycosyltransferase [Pararcticibacter amylolyticus]|uniref:Glycosyltransferase subfamily 4-like N-terminal domain-containing protein n=1 Tax=Pararcticibacter amylolyticus TaxID=2173175 RepID=A0A2U2PI15_9SPHI|nr:glycosyltransferase [Pararcticibacter amylolyticus]PWG81031.1 hypothetical protein DDR33_08875 [Pararcticibacter amylolyticus]
MKQEVCYFLYNERPSSGLINSQVLSLLKEIKSSSLDLNITVVAFWQFWIYFKYRAELAEMTSKLRGMGVRVKSFPFAIPERFFFSNRFPLMLARVLVSLFVLVSFKKYDVIHSRGYFSSLITSDLKKWLGFPKILFDGRSLYPLEHITIGTWKETDPIFKYWKDLEKRIIENSTYSIGVSRPLVDELKRISPKAKVCYIPCCVDTQRLYYSEEQRNLIRDKMDWKDKHVIVYLGSLNIDFWNDINIYGSYFKRIAEIDQSAFFLIVTNSDTEVLKVVLRSSLPVNSFKIISSKYDDLYKWLSASDAGIQVMKPIADGFSRLGVKVAEYLACGLPIIVNSNVGGAAAILKEHDTGVELNIEDPELFKSKYMTFIGRFDDMRQKCMTLAEKEFSIRVVSDRYKKIYRNG